MNPKVTFAKKQQLAVTASTMPQLHTKTTFSHFGKPRRSEKRLNSTIRFHPQKSEQKKKFSSLKNRNVTWQKWKSNTFPVLWNGFTGMLKKKVGKLQKENENNRISQFTQLKLRHKIREVTRLQSDIERAKENNRLIEVIEDYHQTKINGFFDHLQEYLNRNP